MAPPPSFKPLNPYFASGPCVKIPGWKPQVLKDALISRSHRSIAGLEKINRTKDLIRQVLEIPGSHQIALVAGSATGAMEMLLWNLIGPRGVDCLVWDVFGHRWAQDIQDQLKIKDIRRLIEAQDLTKIDQARDLVFTWNASTSGRCLPQDYSFENHRQGLTICDATSAAFALLLPWDSLDATAFSWQKGLGGEAGVGVIVLGPRALERLDTYQPPWPVPHLFRLKYPGIFQGLTLNTLSLLLVEDALQALNWAMNQGGIVGLNKRVQINFKAIDQWVKGTPWIDFLETQSKYRSPTTICLKFPEQDEWPFVQQFCGLLEQHHAAFDIKNHQAAPPSLRLWAGPTVEVQNLELLFPWFDWAYKNLRKS